MAASHQKMEEDIEVQQKLSAQGVRLKDTDEQSLEVRSHVSGSHRTKSSRASAISMAAAQARADAEAAKARAAYSRKEKELKIEKARLEAELDALSQERDAEAAIAKALVMEAAAGEVSSRSSLAGFESLPKEKNVQEKVSEYVANHTQVEDYEEELDLTPQSPRLPALTTHIHGHNASTPAQPSTLPDNGIQQRLGPQQPHIQPPVPHHAYIQPPVSHRIDRERRVSQLNTSYYQYSQGVNQPQPKREPGVSSYTPHHTPSQDVNGNISDLAKFLIRSQLVTSGLSRFDDQPENYLSWKATFTSVLQGLDISATNEVDLLIKWLGPESSQLARRMKSVSIGHPSAALGLIWTRLEERYGAPEAIEKALFAKLDNFPKISNRDNHRLSELADFVLELEAAKQDSYLQGLAYLDTARGVGPIVEKLPFYLQEKWMAFGSKYKEQKGVAFPPFVVFSEFIRREAKARNDPSFNTCSSAAPILKREKTGNLNNKNQVTVHKTNVSKETTESGTNQTDDPNVHCPIHKKPHPLRKCKSFRAMLLDDRKKFLKDNGVCFRCCASVSHMARNCDVAIKCAECNSEKHLAALHPGPTPKGPKAQSPYKDHGGESKDVSEQSDDASSSTATTMCTQVCGQSFKGKSCSKICLVNVYPQGHRDKMKRMYVILDDQSNVSLAKTEFFDAFHIEGPSLPYILTTCAGATNVTGRRAHGYVVEPLTGELSIPLPTLIECNNVPNSRAEIPTPEAAHHHSHMQHIADRIPALDNSADIWLLLGRDILRVHKVRQQYNGPPSAPFAQRHDLGWVIVGDVCLSGAHSPKTVNTFKTCFMENGRPSCMDPCLNVVKVKEDLRQSFEQDSPWSCATVRQEDHLGGTVFSRSDKDNHLAPSIDDLAFLQLMDKEFVRDDSGSWVAPLPFRTPRKPLPNNKQYAYERFMSLQRNFRRRPNMKEDFIEFMQGILDNHHAERAPPLEDGKEAWYLPIFGVYHPQKPGKIRVVFDSSASNEGVSLNDVLLQGPNLNNSLLGVLLRFRKDPVAVTADIKQMFYCFYVKEEHRDVLRFLWFKDNNPENEVVDYRMTVHVFGNSPSPAVATYGLRRSAQEGEKDFGNDVCEFIKTDFYVDDVLRSFPSEAEAVDVLTRAQQLLKGYNIKLHKIASNKTEVMEAFLADDRAKSIEALDLAVDDLPVQRSLGVVWDMTKDTFTFTIPESQKPFTRRGVLSTINSLFDPLGFLAPVTIQGRFLLRELVSQGTDWDTPLPDEKFLKWQRWQESLQELNQLNIPRTYASFPVTTAKCIGLCVFSDASVKAIAAVAYLKVEDENGHTEVSFVLGKAKLAPLAELTIPRLELCAAVLATEIADQVKEELGQALGKITFFTDSKVTLGYINNRSRRFYVFVSNRIHRIWQSSHPSQWRYVATKNNPADHATRSVSASQLQGTNWFTGPKFLLQPDSSSSPDSDFQLVDPYADPELRPEATTFLTKIAGTQLDSQRFEKFSSWERLTRAVARLRHIAQSFQNPAPDTGCVGWHLCKKGVTASELTAAERVIIKTVQHEVYADEIRCIQQGQDLPTQSPVKKLQPVVDAEGLLRVGGRIARSNLPTDETHPLLIPGKHYVATLFIRHHHFRVQHQGRHFTEGAVRASGLWIVGAKRAISSVVFKCVVCRRLRGKLEQQQMADLPQERLKQEPPFTYVGLDVFGPWEVVTRRTRGGSANSKRWAVLFTCMSTRAVHIEVIETMSASSCINALRRFFAIRGPARQLRSDRGTNFVGANSNLKAATEAEEESVNTYLSSQRCTWVFNPPHASNMGGSWERMIGTARRILDSMLLQAGRSKVTHEVLCTFMAEVTAIINSRPLIPVSSDSEAPLILTPAMLLTQKSGTPPAPPADSSEASLLRHQWKRVQALAETFWARWRREYLSVLQARQKWHAKKPNLKEGDIVLLKDKQARRNEWSIGRVEKTFPSEDGLVRKVDVKVASHHPPKTYLRPVSDVVLLVEAETCFG